MIVLDSDHVSVLQHTDSRLANTLQSRLDQSMDEITVTAISLEEQSRGWLSEIHRQITAKAQVPYYAHFVQLFEFYAHWRVLGFDNHAATEFDRLRQLKLRVGTMDLKIAAMTIVNDATLLTRNMSDFARIPGLLVEDWLSQP